MSLEIREFQPEDASIISQLICTTLQKVNSKDYSKTVINRMCEHFSPDVIGQLADKRHMYVICDQEKIIGTGSYENDVIYTVFVDPDQHGKGTGRTIMNFLEDKIRSEGFSLSKVPSSISAESFYEKLGYRKVREHFEEEFGKNIIMEKSL